MTQVPALMVNPLLLRFLQTQRRGCPSDHIPGLIDSNLEPNQVRRHSLDSREACFQD